MDRVAVIIPVYNVEKYLRKCLESVINQTYGNLEIIIIDDGSTDTSGDICEFYKFDERVRVFHVENGGLSRARNSGILYAHSDYVMFVDSDDYLELDCIEYLMKLLHYYNADVVCCDAFNDFADKQIPWHQDVEESLCMSAEEAIERMFYSEYFEDTAWGKIYKKNLFNNIRYPEDRKQAEETSTTYRVLLEADMVVVGLRCKYHYVMHESGLSRVAYRPQQMLMQQAGKECLDYISVNFPKLVQSATRRYVYDCFWVLRRIVFSDKCYSKEINFLIGEIKKYSNQVFWDRRSKLRDKFAIFIIFFGKNFFKISWVLYNYFRKN